MNLKSEVLQWFSNVPSRSLEGAYKASKRIRHIKKDYLSYKCSILYSRHPRQAIVSHMNTELNNSVFIIYWSVLECKISIHSLNLLNKLRSIISKGFYIFIDPHSVFVDQRFCILPESNLYNIWSYPSNIPFFLSTSREPRASKKIKKTFEKKRFFDYRNFQNKNYIVSSDLFRREPNKIEQMNRKLAWIEATPNDPDNWKRYYSLLPSLPKMEDTSEKKLSFSESKDSIITTVAYESIGLVPRSITRTSSGFQTGLIGQSSSLVLHEFQLAKYQTLASLQYIGCSILIPCGISIFLKGWFLEPRIENWWNTYQSQIFTNFFREERALERLREVEELLWLDKMMLNSLKAQSQDLNMKIHEKTIQLVTMHNEESIQAIPHPLTDIIYFATLSALLILDRERLAVLNPWIQELFYSLSDTMKAFSIPLFTDPRIGFHSPHGWEIYIDSFLSHLGFARNKHIVSRFVSTFPVISDTVFKHWISRHSNRISPSIVATHHTTNE
uniref:Potassium/proton antiporter CemA n=6 Tax=Isoetes TaxID=13838 RepID=A0A2U8KKP1_ISOEC|nr:chloroplast envelope membrane protein [Isoetes flaccida]YP_009498857.1 chloroplast envelope membrane protein [Isoetes valida]AWK91683.1 chloroplast envelope membrane protein [Isoetes flaccida var. flaccida]AWK91767.1 chloroplast envelope membrane protein [Isoetes lithophila]AWK92523.1 chloroplast envelope membrane protein [Isoetes echinospora]AYM34996.1 chloroplast envelope membrane protein [Isoetes virginica]UDP54554.1 envelope membrane carbon uptake protein [Isoetes aff. sp. A PWS-2021]